MNPGRGGQASNASNASFVAVPETWLLLAAAGGKELIVKLVILDFGRVGPSSKQGNYFFKKNHPALHLCVTLSAKVQPQTQKAPIFLNRVLQIFTAAVGLDGASRSLLLPPIEPPTLIIHSQKLLICGFDSGSKHDEPTSSLGMASIAAEFLLEHVPVLSIFPTVVVRAA